MIPADSRSTEELSSRLDDIAVGAAGHQAVLHPARGRKISRQPHPERQKRSRDDQADHRAAPAIALFGVRHLRGPCQEASAPITPVARLSHPAPHGGGSGGAVGNRLNLVQPRAACHDNDSMTLPLRAKRAHDRPRIDHGHRQYAGRAE